MTASPSAQRFTALAAELGDRLGPTAVQTNASIGELTTYRVGGDAAVLVEANSLEDLQNVQGVCADFADPVALLVVGLGSNLLVSDAGFEGVAVRLGEGFTTVNVEGEQVVAGAAAKLPVVARKSGAEGLTGFEWAVGVPGSIGGAVRMNAGGHGADMSDSLISASIIDFSTGETRSGGPAELEFAYRSSNIADTEVVVSARLQLRTGVAEEAKRAMSDIVRWRLDHQPGGQNAGSVFTNPEGDSAGRLIDAAGLKGLRVGTAEVSTKHANFIQSEPGGRADDVWALMQRIVAEVEEFSGVVLHPETRMVGFTDRSGP